MTRTLRRWVPFTLLVLIALPGCGQKTLSKKETFPVQGRLMLDGKPVRYALVRFIPADENEGTNATGSTDDDGVFKLRTYSGPDGAVPGRYKLELEEYDVVRMGEIPAGVTPTKIPEKSRTPEVIVEVKAEDNNLGDIKID